MNVTRHIVDSRHGPVEELRGPGGAIAVNISQDDLTCDHCGDGYAIWHIGHPERNTGGMFCESDWEQAFADADGSTP